MKHIPIRSIEYSSHEKSPFEHFKIDKLETLLRGKDMYQPLHRHNFYYLMAIQKGSGTHQIDFQHYEFWSHSLFLLKPGQVHKLHLSAGSRGFLVRFGIEFFDSADKRTLKLLRKACRVNLYTQGEHLFLKILTFLDFIYDEFCQKEKGFTEVIQAQLKVLFIILIRESTLEKEKSTHEYAQDRLESLLELIAEHYKQHKQVATYAEMMSLTPYQLNAITKSTVGKTSSTLINEHLVLEAKRHLLASSQQVGQIAESLGYEDVSYFIRFFKRHTAYSPEAYRKKFS